MSGIAWLLELVLLGLLAGVLFQALRLERALGVLKRDRASLEQLVAGFNASTRQAEAGIERLRGAADGAGRVLAKQTESALSLKDDLSFLSERAERVADRLESVVRRTRPLAPEAKPAPASADVFAAGAPVMARGKATSTPVSPAERLENAVRRARVTVAKAKQTSAKAKHVTAADIRVAEAAAI